MTPPVSLSTLLRDCVDGAPEWQAIYDEFVARMTAISAGAGAPRVGSEFPALSLPDWRGRYQKLSTLYADGPIVVSFNRGSWCPYCRHELECWRDVLPDLGQAGAQLVVVAGVVGGRASELSALLDDQAVILCDVDHGAALGLGLAYHAGIDVIARYLQCGLDLADLYGSASGVLPIPATFVVDRGGIVRYSFVDADFRRRAEPGTVLDIVRGLGAA